MNKEQRAEVLKRDSFTCQDCGKKYPDNYLDIEKTIHYMSRLTIDHILGRYKDCEKFWHLLITLCWKCHVPEKDWSDNRKEKQEKYLTITKQYEGKETQAYIDAFNKETKEDAPKRKERAKKARQRSYRKAKAKQKKPTQKISKSKLPQKVIDQMNRPVLNG